MVGVDLACMIEETGASIIYEDSSIILANRAIYCARLTSVYDDVDLTVMHAGRARCR